MLNLQRITVQINVETGSELWQIHLDDGSVSEFDSRSAVSAWASAQDPLANARQQTLVYLSNN